MKIYQILPNGYFGGMVEVSDDVKGIPFGYTRTAIPANMDADDHAVWIGNGWRLTKQSPTVENIIPVEEPSIESYGIWNGLWLELKNSPYENFNILDVAGENIEVGQYGVLILGKWHLIESQGA